MTTINPRLTQITRLAWLTHEESAAQRAIIKARLYHEGIQLYTLTDRMRDIVGIKASEEIIGKLNVCRPVINAVAERLAVKQFVSGNKNFETWANDTWSRNRMDIKQDSVHRDALRDGEAFIVLGYDQNRGVEMIPHQRYTSTELSGGDSDNFGVRVFYENDDPNQPVKYAQKIWIEDLGEGKTRKRKTDYYADRIERYEMRGAGWEPYGEEGYPPVEPWLAKDGSPLGVPVVHYYEPDMRPHAWDAFQPQDAIQNSVIDMLASSRLSGFRFYVARGFMPTTDGRELAADFSNAPRVEPGTILANTKDASSTAFDTIEGEASANFIGQIDKLIYYTAIVTDTPLSRFQMTGQVAAADTLKEQNDPLIKKVEKRQSRFGDAWEDVMILAARIEAAFGDLNIPEDADIEAVWEPAQMKTIADQEAEARAKKAAGIPEETIWSEVFGYSQEQIDLMKSQESYQRRIEQSKIMSGFPNG